MPGDLPSDNDNTFIPDAHGQAALLLVESLIHGLVSKSIISVANAVEIIEVATEVKRDIGADGGDASPSFKRSIVILEAISRSLRHDLEDGLVEDAPLNS